MGIQFAIHTYGHFDAMFYVLNGIKMIMASDFTDGLIKLMALIATSYYSLRGMAAASQGGVGHYLLKTIGMLMVITALLTPKADMLVVDRISGKKEIISGLPYAFVLPVGVLEAIGAGITSLFEQAFTPVSTLAYKDYGLIFGQRLVQESKNWRINNPEFASNMNVFLKRCVVLEAMIGTRFTPDDVFTSTDIFRLVTENAGTFRQVDFRVNKRLERVNCQEAGRILKTYLRPEIDFLNFKYKNSEFSIAGGRDALGMNQLLTKNLEAGYASSLGVKEAASDIIRQNMMINALKDYNNTNDKYGYTRADDLQKSNWKISGELAKEYLPLLLNIMKGLIYSSFIFIVPLMILSGGVTHYLKYCTVVFSLQIWPALNAVLNLFIELYSNLRGSALTGGALTFANFNGAYDAVDSIVLVASGLQMSIPFLSFAIVQGGVGSFINLASTLQGASASAAGTASSELTSGNRSFDNISRDTASIGNKSGFKTDFNQSYQEGATQIQGADGSILRNFADGTSSITTGSGTNLSSGSRRFNLSQGEQTAAQENISSLLSSAKSDDQSYSESVASQMRSASNLVSTLAQRESAGESFDYKALGEKGQNLQQMVNSAKALHDRDGYSFEQSASAAIRPYVDAGGKIPDFIPFVKGEAGVRIDGAVEAGNRSNQSLDREESANRSNDTSASFTNQEAASRNKQWMKDNNIDNSFSEDTQASYEKGKMYQESASQKREEANTWHQVAEYSKNNSASDDREMYHDVEQAVMKRYGVSQEAAHQMIDTGDKRVDKVWKDISHSYVAGIKERVQLGKESVENNANQNASLFRNEHYSKVNRDGLDNIKSDAAFKGLNQEQIKSKVEGANTELRAKQENITKENDVQYRSVKYANELLESGLEKRADQYEKDRIGQGKISKGLNVLAQIPTLGNAGSNIGGPNKTERSMQNLQGNIKPLSKNKDS